MTSAPYLLVALLAPLAASALIALACRRRGGWAAALSAGAAAVTAIFALLAVGQVAAWPESGAVPWFRFGGFNVMMGFLFDGTAATMLVMVAVVALLIHVFSLGYMADDGARGRYFGGLSFFLFSMLGIVLADNLVMIFVFWELVGFSSYLLIGHYLDTEEAAGASKKAFIVNRAGDFGFLIGIVLAYWHFGATDLAFMAQSLERDPALMHAGIAALLACGFVGKSAQFPLHVWLPDAMAGPTPVSALIHAATMVAAGVYLLIRIAFLFPPEVLSAIAWLGAGTAVFAGVLAFGQSDIKRVLAYSTLSQLGYMAAAFGLGFPGIAFFHLLTHAFFKALLFLGAGSVIHACHHEQDMFRLGGLVKRMPVTSATFAVGSLALCGVYGLSGFYSKDAILIAGAMQQTGIFVLLAIGAFLTAGYMGRLFWIAFLGEPKSEAASKAHENGPAMTVPLVLLAVLSVGGGWTALWPDFFGGLARDGVDALHHREGYGGAHKLVLGLGTAAWIVGLGGAFLFYGAGARKDRLRELLPAAHAALRARLGIDPLYNWYVAKIQQRAADVFAFLDEFVLKGIFVRGSAGLVGALGLGARALHAGSVGGYLYWFVGGLVVLWLIARGIL